jgi:hypothetical protein
LAILVLLAGDAAGSAAIVYWFMSDPAPGGFRLEGVWGIDNPVHASVLLLAGTLPVLSRILSGQRARLWVAGAVVPLCFVVLAGARTAAAAYLLVVLTMVAARKPGAAVWVLAGALIVMATAIVLLGTGVTEEVWLTRGLSYRDVVWEQVWSAYRDCNPLVGCGISTPLTVDIGGVEGGRAHSIFFAALYHQGLLGLAVFVGGLGWLLWRGLRRQSLAENPALGWAWMLGYVLLANATSGDHILVRAALFWPCFWMPVMVLAAMDKESSQPEPT